jgi:hypothetical protein
MSATSNGVYLLRDLGAEVNTQSEIEVMWTNGIAEFFRTFEFFLLEPFFEKILATLCKDGTSKFERFMTIQRALVEEDPKVLEDWGELTGLHGNMFESFDCIWSSKNTLRLKRP